MHDWLISSGRYAAATNDPNSKPDISASDCDAG